MSKPTSQLPPLTNIVGNELIPLSSNIPISGSYSVQIDLNKLKEFTNQILLVDTLPVSGSDNTIYLQTTEDKLYRWELTQFVEVSAGVELGETSETAFRGDYGKTAYDHTFITGSNPHETSATDIELTPSGSIVSTNVEGAIYELATEKVDKITNYSLVSNADILRIHDLQTADTVEVDVSTFDGNLSAVPISGSIQDALDIIDELSLGHTIQDSGSFSMTQRDNLKFSNHFSVTDNSGGNSTDVTLAHVTTVGTGGDYANIGGAIAAGKIGTFLLLSDVTETGNVTFGSGLFTIKSNGAKRSINMTSYYFTTSVQAYIDFENITIRHTAALLDGSGGVNKPEYSFFNCIIINESTNNNVVMVRTNAAFIIRRWIATEVTLPNKLGAALSTAGANVSFLEVNGMTISGGGANITGQFANLTADITTHYNMRLFITTAATATIYLNSADDVYVASTAIGRVYAGLNLSNFRNAGAGILTADTTHNLVNINNANGTLNLQFFGTLNISNVLTKFLLIDNSGSLGGRINNMRVTDATAITLSKSDIDFSNCTFSGTLIISGDNNSLSMCNIGSVNAGTKTITVQATADKTILIGNRTEATIVDSGTNTNSSNNLLF